MERDISDNDFISVTGAKEHNLQNISVEIPHYALTVLTGVSGSGKSSLAFDTIYAEGQRRYLETLSAYARQFIGQMERPEVEDITGLSPVISIEQKTTGWNPRSTVGTVTELYDFLRLLYARIGVAYSYKSGERMVKYDIDQILARLKQSYEDKKIAVLAPVVRGRKGHYRELFLTLRKQGFSKIRINGEYQEIRPGMKLDRYKTHDIDIVVDRLKVAEEKYVRLREAVELALDKGNGLLFIEDLGEHEITTYSLKLMDPKSDLSYEEPSPNSFSFNSPYGACPRCNGLGTTQEVDISKVIPDDSLSINQIGILPFGEVRDNLTFKQLRKISKKYKFTFSTPVKDIPSDALDLILHGGGSGYQFSDRYMIHEMNYNLAEKGLVKMLKHWYENSSSEKIRRWAENFMTIRTCPECEGSRLKKESRYIKINDHNIADLSYMDLGMLKEWFEDVEKHLDERQNLIAKDLLKEIRYRLKFLSEVGLHYLHLHRQARSLSGGESQRTRLATQIGSQLTGITYILDEPSIGLHQRDNRKLISSLHHLVEIGNTVIVVEHDKEIMLASDYLIDLGPGAGSKGGKVVDIGSPQEFKKGNGITAKYLKGEEELPIPAKRRKGSGKSVVLKGASGHNLQNVNVKFPLGKLICVTGVSGSGKSTLINETLYPILRQHFYKSLKSPLSYTSFKGLELVDKVIEVDQSPIGRTPRSNPATYTKVFDEIRKLFTKVPEAQIRGYKPGRFSFNVKGGRCEVCKGGGLRLIEMNFLPNVYVECEACNGQRYNRETLEIIYKGKNISDVLNMTVSEAGKFFEKIPKIARKLKILNDIGLSYITLGQSATTLSGGEAQRVKLSLELTKRDTGKTIYILDEPTTGLHFEDIKHLLKVLNRLVDKGNTVIVIEHNLDVIKMADHIIDIGPEAGREGGEIVAVGTPEKLTKSKISHTGSFLKEELSLS